MRFRTLTRSEELFFLEKPSVFQMFAFVQGPFRNATIRVSHYLGVSEN